MDGKRIAGVALTVMAVAGCAGTIFFGQHMRRRGEQFWSRFRAAASPDEQRAILARGYFTPPSKVSGKTIPIYTGCAVAAILGLMCFRDAKQRDRQAQQHGGQISTEGAPSAPPNESSP